MATSATSLGFQEWQEIFHGFYEDPSGVLEQLGTAGTKRRS
jgi:hypothetical protein